MAEEAKLTREEVNLILGVVLGVGGIAAVAYVAYMLLVGPLDAKKEELKYWQEEFTRELKEYTSSQQGALTEAQEKALEVKRGEVERVSKEIAEMGGNWVEALVAVGGVVAGVWLVHKLARDYWDTHKDKISTPAGWAMLMRNAVNIDFFAGGQTSLAIAAQTQTDYMFKTMLTPALQAEISYLTNILPSLTGLTLMWAQMMITGLQTEMLITIPAFISVAWTIMGATPPI
jgi:hypothetical protein